MKVGRITRSWTCSCECHSTWDAEHIHGDLLGVSEWDEERECVQFIRLDEGDYDRLTAELDAGACPICDGWEDGGGNPVRPFEFGEEIE